MTDRVLAAEGGVYLVADMQMSSNARNGLARVLRLANLGPGHALVHQLDVAFDHNGQSYEFAFPLLIRVAPGDEADVLTSAALYAHTEEGAMVHWQVEHAAGQGNRTFTFHVMTPAGRVKLPVRAAQMPRFVDNQTYEALWRIDLMPSGAVAADQTS